MARRLSLSLPWGFATARGGEILSGRTLEADVTDLSSGVGSRIDSRAVQGQRRPRKFSQAPWSEVPPTKGVSKTTSTAAEWACIAIIVPRWPNGAPIWPTLHATTRSPRRGDAQLVSISKTRARDATSVASCSARTSAAGTTTVSRVLAARERIAARFVAARCTAATAPGDMATVEVGTRAVVAMGSPASHLQASRRRTSGSSCPNIRAAPAKTTGAHTSVFWMPESASATASKTAGKRLR
mmetsp:Transcript_4037/g.12584  ORF Transcript_4037/g.12584 Transcript_4037/m.12584 type:complete len:241 (+) Transcript_4037:974-1696(+)